MSFLFPVAAWLGLLALPVIAFYLLKTRQRRKPVSTLLFWRQIQPKVENSPLWRKLRRWLSLALQLLILALLIAAIARPAFDWEKQSPLRTLLVLDPSASMQAGSPGSSRWDQALQQVRTSVARLRLGDEMALITAEDPPRLLSGWTSSQRDLREALDRAVPIPVGSDPRVAMELARELCALRENSRLEVLSDSVWPLTSEDAIEMTKNVVVRGRNPDPASNTGISHFAVRRSLTSPGDWQLDAEIVSSVPYSGLLEISRDGQPMDRSPAEVYPGKPWRKSWRGTAREAATFSAAFPPAANDLLASDNSASCNLAALLPIRVLLAGPADGAFQPFLEAVLDSIPLVQWSRVSEVPGQADCDLLIAGGSVLPTAPPGCAVLLIDPQSTGFWGEKIGSGSELPITDSRTSNRLLKHTALASLAIHPSARWIPAPSAEVFASSMDLPVIFGQWTREPAGRWLVLAADPAASDLPLRTAFPIFIGNLVQSLRGESLEKSGVAVLPGAIESVLAPTLPDAGGDGFVRRAELPVLPGWWWVLAGALLVLTAEWALFHRRITD